jgi:Ca2+-transporting ATPase
VSKVRSWTPSARSDDRSAFVQLFRNRWLWTAIAVSLVLQVAVVHTTFVQPAFVTVGLSVTDWVKCTVAASSVLWAAELRKAGCAVFRGVRLLSDHVVSHC